MKYIHACIALSLAGSIKLCGMENSTNEKATRLFDKSDFSWQKYPYYQEIKKRNEGLELQALAFADERAVEHLVGTYKPTFKRPHFVEIPEGKLVAVALREDGKDFVTIHENTGNEYRYHGALSVQNGPVNQLKWVGYTLFAVDSKNAIVAWESPVKDAVISEEKIEKKPTILHPDEYVKHLKKLEDQEREQNLRDFEEKLAKLATSPKFWVPTTTVIAAAVGYLVYSVKRS